MLEFLCVLSWVGVVYFRSIPYLWWDKTESFKLQQRKTSLTLNRHWNSVDVTHIICTDLILHVFSNDTRLVCICCNVRWRIFTAIHFKLKPCRVSLHCAVVLYQEDSRSSWARSSFPILHKLIGWFHNDLCMLHGHELLHMKQYL